MEVVFEVRQGRARAVFSTVLCFPTFVFTLDRHRIEGLITHFGQKGLLSGIEQKGLLTDIGQTGLRKFVTSCHRSGKAAMRCDARPLGSDPEASSSNIMKLNFRRSWRLAPV